MKFFRKNWSNLVVILLAFIFFSLTSLYNYLIHEEDYVKWGSPDETANYFFVKNFALDSRLAVFEEANIIHEEIVRPRSVRSDHAWLKPVSFLGIIIYFGFLAKIVGVSLIPYFTPFIAALGIIFFYLLIKRLFSERIALISSFLLASFPVYIYYTIRSMFHNVLFLVFLIFFLYFISLSLSKKYSIKNKFLEFKLKSKVYLGMFFSILAGLFLGGAISSRTSEIIWLLPTILIIYPFYFKRLGLRVFLVLSGILLAYLPIAYYNQLLYGSFLYGGYSEMNTSIQEITVASQTIISSGLSGSLAYFNNYFEIIKKNVFYFGYKPRQSLDMFYNYVLLMFPVLSALSALGLILFLISYFRRLRKWKLVYLLAWFILSSILVLYYGSWEFFDNPDPSRYTIGNSYTRYWLPLYLLAIPLASMTIVFFAKLLSGSFSRPNLLGRYDRARKYLSNGLQVLAVSSFISISLTFVIFGSEEGLIHSYYNHFRDKEAVAMVLNKTEDEAIIVTQYHDKQLFPERKVVVALLNHDRTNETLGKLIDYYPVYYYNFFFPEADFNYLNNRRLVPFGFNIELVSRYGPFGLYRLIKYENYDL